MSPFRPIHPLFVVSSALISWRGFKALTPFVLAAETETKKKKKKKAKFDGNPRPVKKTKPTPKIPEFPLQQFIAEFPTPYVTSASPAPIIPTFEVPASPAPGKVPIQP